MTGRSRGPTRSHPRRGHLRHHRVWPATARPAAAAAEVEHPRAALINVMQGLEDIPEAVMAEDFPGNWETFPDYLNALAARRWDADVAAYLPHSPLRVLDVMGQRGWTARRPLARTSNR